MPHVSLASRRIVCTIVSRNYIHFARTLMDSVRAVHPDWEQYVLIVDEMGDGADLSNEKFEVVNVRGIGIPDFQKFFFRYSILEANTAVKPWFLDWLFREKNADRVTYFDPDIFVYRPLFELERELDKGNFMVLTPHLTGDLRDGKKPNEFEIMQAGCYNLGFLALAKHQNLHPFLKWWQIRLEYDCIVDFARGLFVDQKWIDLVPGLFDAVSVLRHPGYNIAYWNLLHRKVTKSGDKYFVNDLDLAFFHFSGLNPGAPKDLSKHQDRFQIDNLGVTRELIEGYCKAVCGNGLEQNRNKPYSFGKFADGAQLPLVIRKYYRQNAQAQEYAGNDPFSSDHAYLNAPWGEKKQPIVTVLMRYLWENQPELKERYPDLEGGDRKAFVIRFPEFAKDFGIPGRFVPKVRNRFLKRCLTSKPAKTVFKAMASALPNKTKVWIKSRLSNNPPIPQSLNTVDLNKSIVSNQKRQITPSLGKKFADGINIIGYVRSEHGLGESARLCARSASAVSLPFSLVDFNTGNNSRTTDSTFNSNISERNNHWANVFHINADQMPIVHGELGSAFFEGHYNIGFWHWELPELPDAWVGSFDYLDEIWVPTRFVQEAINQKTSIPVLRMPHSVSIQTSPNLAREYFGLPENKFLFLAMYDTHSVRARKNPDAVLEAFRKAFPNNPEVGLVLKINNPASYPEEVAEIKSRLQKTPGIHVIDRILSRQEVYDLENLCDSFVSLHRSEGFGLGLAESMFLGKPVIGTDWSGNQDFMNAGNSCPVRCRLVKLEKNEGPYPKGQYWAEPEVDHASWYMKKIVGEPAWARSLAEAGRMTIHTDFSPAAVGALYVKRLNFLRSRHGLEVSKPPKAIAA